MAVGGSVRVDRQTGEPITGVRTGGSGIDLGLDSTSTDSEYVLGGNNVDFLTGEADPTAWMDNLAAIMLREIRASADAIGESKEYANQVFESQWGPLLQRIDRELIQGRATSSLGRTALSGLEGSYPVEYWMTGSGFNRITDFARAVVQSNNSELAGAWETGTGSTTRSSGGGGGRLPTESEIRAQFDLDQLAAAAQNRWRGTLLDEMKDPRGLAREYVDAIVAGKGQQKIDFDTFVDKRIEGTSRFASIYRNKPKSMSNAQFLQPYFQSAQQVLGASDEAASVAIGGAQFGASGQAFQARLDRTDAATSGAPFINNLEARMTDLRKVFR